MPQIGRHIRRIGRPRQDWTSQPIRVGGDRMGAERFDEMMNDQTEGSQLRWKIAWAKIFAYEPLQE